MGGSDPAGDDSERRRTAQPVLILTGLIKRPSLDFRCRAIAAYILATDVRLRHRCASVRSGRELGTAPVVRSQMLSRLVCAASQCDCDKRACLPRQHHFDQRVLCDANQLCSGMQTNRKPLHILPGRTLLCHSLRRLIYAVHIDLHQSFAMKISNTLQNHCFVALSGCRI